MGGQARGVLPGLGTWEVLAIPRQPRPVTGDRADAGDRERAAGRAQRAAALTPAYHAGGPVAFGSVRDWTGGPVRILARISPGAAFGPGRDGLPLAQVALDLAEDLLADTVVGPM